MILKLRWLLADGCRRSLIALIACLVIACGGGGGGGGGGGVPGSPATVSVPNVAGSPQAAATSAITAAGLTVGTVTTQSSGTVASGRVISESPDAGALVASGSTINLIVSTGSMQVAVPDVLGRAQAVATTAITGAGLAVGTVATQSSRTVLAGNVISESPGAGALVVGGTVVNLVISNGPTQVAIPNVVGQTQATAAAALTGAGLALGTVAMQSSSSVAAGNVISESPGAGALVVGGSTVNLVVSTGPTGVAVPSVVGQTQAAATTMIAMAGLTVGSVTPAFSTTAPAGTVVSESPAAGALVAPGAPVSLRVSSSLSTGTFSATGSTITSRGRHTATLLSSGRVLVAGGIGIGSGSRTVLASAEIYDPATGTFSATGGMITARWGHVAALLPSGKVVLYGGNDSAGVGLRVAEIYDPATGTFSATQSSIDGVQTATVLLNGTVLGTGSGGKSAELYISTSGIFLGTNGVPVANNLQLDTTTLLGDGTVLVAGGIDDSNGTAAIPSAETYDPSTGLFSATGNMVTPRVHHTATLVNGSVLVAGGNVPSALNQTGSNVANAELYDGSTRTFSATTGSLGTARQEHTATLLNNGTVLLAGGGATPMLGGLASAEIYYPAMRSFGTTGSMIAARIGHTATLLRSGTVLLVGGNAGSSVDAELYVP